MKKRKCTQSKISRLIRLDQLLRNPNGLTLNEIMQDEQMDEVSKRLLQENLKEIEETYNAEFETNMFRGRERLWRYKDTNFSIMKQTTKDLEIIRKSIDNLSLFKGDPRFDILRFYLIGIENGRSEVGFNLMSFDNNNDVTGLEHIETILKAITNKYPIKIHYKPFKKKECEINIHPYHLRQYNRRWFLFGFVEDCKEIRNYALDRINHIEHLSKPYIPTEIDFDTYFDDIVGVSNYKGKTVEKVLLKVSNRSIDYIRTKPIHWTQTELKSRNTKDYSFIQLNVKINIELEMLLFSYGDALEVIEPNWLRVFFATKVKNMFKFYEE